MTLIADIGGISENRPEKRRSKLLLAGMNLGGTKRSGSNLASKWLPDMDSNHDKQIQRLLCYHYTIGQTGRGPIN